MQKSMGDNCEELVVRVKNDILGPQEVSAPYKSFHP